MVAKIPLQYAAFVMLRCLDALDQLTWSLNHHPTPNLQITPRQLVNYIGMHQDERVWCVVTRKRLLSEWNGQPTLVTSSTFCVATTSYYSVVHDRVSRMLKETALWILLNSDIWPITYTLHQRIDSSVIVTNTILAVTIFLNKAGRSPSVYLNSSHSERSSKSRSIRTSEIRYIGSIGQPLGSNEGSRVAQVWCKEGKRPSRIRGHECMLSSYPDLIVGVEGTVLRAPVMLYILCHERIVSRDALTWLFDMFVY